MDVYSNHDIISIGDSVRDFSGKFDLFSRFKNVANYKNDDKILSIGGKNFSNGPNNILIKDFSNIPKYIIFKENIHYGQSKYSWNNIHFFDSQLNIKFNNEIFFNNFHIFKKILFSFAKKDSYIYLQKNFNLLSSYRKKLYTTLNRGIKHLINSDFSDGSLLAGCGLGLTPQGDDIINGVLMALSTYEKIFGINLSIIKEKLYHSVKEKLNIFSKNFLFYSFNGKFYENFKNLICKMNKKQDIFILNIFNYLNLGHTSGSDTLYGFYFTLKTLLQVGGNRWLKKVS